MKHALVSLTLFLVSLPALASYRVGDTVSDMCWNDVNGDRVCLSSFKDKIRVLIYNAGWCGPCNSEFEELVPEVSQFDGKPVQFISLSAQGWSRGSRPDQEFLQEWKDRHSIPFTVAAAPNDYGGKFGANAIPNVAIIGSDGTLKYKAIAPGTDPIIRQVKRLLGR